MTAIRWLLPPADLCHGYPMKVAYKAANVAEAEIVRGMLEANGLEAHVGGYYLQGGVGEMATMDFAHVHVANEDFDKARELIHEYEGDAGQPDNSRSSQEVKTATTASRLVVVLIAGAVTLFLAWMASS